MANLKISQLTETINPISTDVFPIVNSSVTKKVTLDTIHKGSYVYTHANFLPLSGGTIMGDLSVSDVLQVGSGTATFYVTEGKVGINTEFPNEDLTVFGNISASSTIIAQSTRIPVNVSIINTNKTFTNNDTNKVFHFDTTSQTLTAIFPDSLTSGFNAALMNTGTNSLALSASAAIKSTGTKINEQYGGVYVYKNVTDIFAVGGLT